MRLGTLTVSAFCTLATLPASAILFSTPVRAMDLNTFRAQHGRPALSISGALSSAAMAQAAHMAGQGRLDHAGFHARVKARAIGTVAAQNVGYGCDSEDCAIRQWSRSGRHRANMLRGDVSSYGIASATGANGKRYWVLELGGE
jgi:uncharacterized protein YkwD